jgi:hypothetical protein
VAKRKIRDNEFYPPKCLCLLDYPLYKLRGLSGAVFRACMTSLLRRKLSFPTSNLTMKNLGPMRGCEHGQRRVSACARAIIETRAHARVCVMGNPRTCARD